MDDIQFQGVLYLCGGAGMFFSLLLGLRTLATATVPETPTGAPDSWLGPELLEVIGRVEECENVVSLKLRRSEGRSIPSFRAGQFLTVQIGADEKLTRSYSICSSEANRTDVQIAVKRIAGGLGSTWMHQLKVGDKIWVYPPSGHFSDDHFRNLTRLYIAGGIGITPILSMVRSSLDLGITGDMYVFYGMRTKRDLGFHSELEELARRHQRLRYFPVLSHESSDWEHSKGFLTFEYVRERVELRPEIHCFLCGPAVLTDPLIDRLLEHGVPEDRVFIERFASPDSLDRSKIPNVKSKIVLEGRNFDYEGNQTLLEFFESQGLEIPYSCRAGVCGTCKCVVQGNTKMLTDAGLTRAERKAGYVLTCVAFPDDGELKINR